MEEMLNKKGNESVIKQHTRIYAKKPSGKLFRLRQTVGYLLLAFFVVAPFIKVSGNPLLMFNILDRKFSIFGTMFYPQDLYIFVFGMLIIMVGIVLFTAIYGRVWCGWTCPQTVFMELVFRRIEYMIEGDWIQQRRLDEGPDSDMRAVKKISKHAIFLFISFFISNIFLAYVIGIDDLLKIATDPIGNHIIGFISIIVFTLIFYSVFAHIREIVCTTICPYGRLQGVLLDEQSITVAYNATRGEPRGKLTAKSSGRVGDCIDCKLCVHVCPTGIDIREGIQMECVSCTACIDACDTVMEKIDKPKRLIGFYSAKQLSGEKSEKYAVGRTITYTSILLLLISIFGVLLHNRSVIDGRILRAKGSGYQFIEEERVSNLYTLELMNKSGKEMPFVLEPIDPEIELKLVNNISKLKKDGSATISFFLIKDVNSVNEYKEDVKINIKSGNDVLTKLKTTFVAPPTTK